MTGRVVVLGYRAGLHDAIVRRGLVPTFIVAKEKPGLVGTDHLLVADLEDGQEVLRAALGHGIDAVDGVLTDHEEAVFTACLLRRHLGCPGDVDHVRTLRFRDKMLQKAALPDDVPRARCVYVQPDSAFEDLRDALGTPFVVKPANGFASKRTAVVHTPDELRDWWAEGATASSIQAVAESFVEGPELHVDGLWQDGALVWSSVCRYLDAPAAWAQGGVMADGLVSPDDEPGLVDAADALTRRVLGHLDAPDTVFHLEAYLQPDGSLTFGECAIRVGGGMIPEVVRLTYGVDLYELVLELGLGVRPSLAPRVPERYHGYVFLRRFEGVELTEADFRDRFDLAELDYPADPDARVGAYGRVGHAILGHPDGAGLRRLLGDVVAFNRTGRDGRGDG